MRDTAEAKDVDCFLIAVCGMQCIWDLNEWSINIWSSRSSPCSANWLSKDQMTAGYDIRMKWCTVKIHGFPPKDDRHGFAPSLLVAIDPFRHCCSQSPVGVDDCHQPQWPNGRFRVIEQKSSTPSCVQAAIAHDGRFTMDPVSNISNFGFMSWD